MEQLTAKPNVTGSNPVRGTNHSTARTPLYCGVRAVFIETKSVT